ncbi:MAG: hypothetical protein E7361_04495 [Clostridiales bacterium]|nr:hypothetical protein [Clostridiales bacterium]
MNLLLADTFFGTLWEKMLALFNTMNFWIAVFICALGVAFLILAVRLTRVHRGEDTIMKGDKVLLTYRILATICIVVAVIIWIFFC